MPRFSVIIPTRNRAALFRAALRSVLAQQDADFEVIAVNDGTSGTEAAALAAVKAEHPGVTFIDLPVTSGHGPCRVTNTGAARASGDFLCFLDDDDLWTDPHHLADAGRIADAHPGVEAMMFDQAAFRGATPAPGPIWLEDFGARLRPTAPPDTAFAVDADMLLTATGFAHVNCLIVRRDVFTALDGFDTTLWYEGDRDFFLRLMDRTTHLRYLPKICARHAIPERASVTTTTSAMDKALDQMRLLHKAARHSRHAAVAAYAKRHRRFALRKALDAALAQPRLLPKLARGLLRLAATPPRTDTMLVAAPASTPP